MKIFFFIAFMMWTLPVRAQQNRTDDTGNLSLRFAIAPLSKKLRTLDIMTPISPTASVGISLTQAQDRLSVFDSPPGSLYTYESNEVPYRMLAMKFELKLPYNAWVGFAVGRWAMRTVKKTNSLSSCSPECILYINGSFNQLAMLIDIEKTYGGLTLGWQTDISQKVSIGLIAMNYIFKGDSSGVQVNTLNERADAERSRVHAAAVSYARRDYFEPPQLFVQYSF